MKNRPGRPTVEEVTPPQAKTLAMIIRIVNRDGVPPTMKELGAALGITPASVHEHVDALVKKGKLGRTPRKSRNLRVLQDVAEIQQMISIPILGSVAAGYPIHAIENVTGHITIESTQATRGKCFALRVQGDSMTRAKILDGCLVIVRQQQIAEHGEIIVAMLGDDVTCKRLFHRDGVIKLMAENVKYKPIVVAPDADFRVIGKVVGVSKVCDTALQHTGIAHK